MFLLQNDSNREENNEKNYKVVFWRFVAFRCIGEFCFVVSGRYLSVCGRPYDDIAAEAKAQGKPVFLVGMGKIPPEPCYMLPIDGEGEVCIYVLSRNSGEGSDRLAAEGDFLLTEDEKRDISLCCERYSKFMLVLNVGGPVDLSPVMEQVQNILVLS